MKPTYRIKDWDRHFENHESRKVKRAYWVPIPNRHDGKSFRRIASHPEGVSVFAAWTLILEVASKMPERGILADEDGPLDADDLSAMTGFPSAIFDVALNLLIQDKFGWLATDKPRARASKSPDASRDIPQPPAVPGETAVEQKGMEGNGTEENGIEDKSRRKPALVHQVFEFWKREMNHPKAQLTAERKAKIEERLKDSTIEEIETAIRGCKQSEFHSANKFDDIELICRKRSKLEHFIALSVNGNGNGYHAAHYVPNDAAEVCSRCHNTGTEPTPKGSRPCNHKAVECV